MPTTILAAERAIDTAELIATSLSATNYPALPTIPSSSNPDLPSSSSPLPPRVSRFVELFDLACTGESSDRGVNPHPSRTRALVPVWKQPSSPRSHESSVLRCSASPAPPRKDSAWRHSSPGDLTLSVARSQSSIPSHSKPSTRVESRETAVDVAGRLVSVKSPLAVSSSSSGAADALCSHQSASRAGNRRATAWGSTSLAPRTTAPIAVLRRKDCSSLNIIDQPASDSLPMGSSSTLQSRAKARSNTVDITTPEKRSHRNSLSRALHFFSPFSIASPPPCPSSDPPSFIVSSRGAGTRLKSPLRSPSSDMGESLAGRTVSPQDEAPCQAKFPEADKTTHISQETASAPKPQPTAESAICSSPVSPSPSPMSSSSRPRSTLVQGAISAPVSSAAPHPPIRSLTSPSPRASHGPSTRRAGDRLSSRAVSLHLAAPAFLRTALGGGEAAGVLGLGTESGGARSGPRKLSKRSNTCRRHEARRRATEQISKSFISRLFARAE